MNYKHKTDPLTAVVGLVTRHFLSHYLFCYDINKKNINTKSSTMSNNGAILRNTHLVVGFEGIGPTGDSLGWQIWCQNQSQF